LQGCFCFHLTMGSAITAVRWMPLGN
jgi:hypothetical protein